MDLLDDLGPQLRALSADQPAQPGDRVPLVTRRARRIQRTRAAVAVAAVLAVAAPAGLLLSSQRHETAQFALSDVTTWSDRSPVGASSLVDGAVASLKRVELGPVSDVKPLYATPLTDESGPSYVAVFIATLNEKRVLVAATSQGHHLTSGGTEDPLEDDGVEDNIPWDLNNRVVLDAAHPVRHVGLYVPVRGSDRFGDFAALAVVLADPSARTLTWRQHPLPYAPAGTPVDPAVLTSTNGVFVGLLGGLTGPVDVTVKDRRGREASFALASGLSQPVLVRPADPDVTPSWAPVLGAARQSEPNADGTWAAENFESFLGKDRRPLTVYARCYGGGAMGFRLRAGTRQSATIAQGRVACDGATHRAFAPARVTTNGFRLEVTSDRLQAYSYKAGYPG